MMALVGQVGRIGCLLVMVLLVCATGIETASGHRHHVNGGDNGNHHQGVASKSRILTKTDSSINQQDQNPMMTIKSLANSGERRVRKRSKWLQSTTSSAPSSSSASMSHHFNKDSTFLKRIVTEVIAERDAQIAAALFEVAKNQPHLQMMVQTLGELSQSNQRLELSSTRLDETQRRLDSRLGVISEKMTLLETRLGHTERRIEREMTQIHGKMDDVFRNIPEKSPEGLMRGVKQIQDQLNVIEEILLERSPTTNQIRGKNRHQHNGKSNHGPSSAELQKVGNSLSQAIAAAHLDLGRAIREAESNLDHQLSMLASDNGVFSCAISKLLERDSMLFHQRAGQVASAAEELLLAPLQTLDIIDPAIAGNLTLGRQLLEGNSIQTADLLTFDQLANNSTKCLLKCP
ncbi:uncharacterized protein LOC116919008 [Daphnia magna]|uniref:Uncharacterized protein n=2 Tax=Daphnia magna TaxID=35525 RepID=A0ABR0ABE5_9CRUS|nr:uncharacterized protein LOC116919008 [Daphnia magna]KAK4022409.1 hypothetical protein OUZ56_007878 [Daphnia magna]KZS17102.1 Uncharacterized protein APZ42_016665 [Daphnia magna]